MTSTWSSAFGEGDLYRFNEGTERRGGEKFGAHLVAGGGVRFAVWAPGARSVNVVGDFNGWQRGSTPLGNLGSSGVWEGFAPDAAQGHTYKYEIETATGERILRADPYASYAERAPATASVIWDLSYGWGDGEWMEARSKFDARSSAMSIYEIHLGSWQRDPGSPDWLPNYASVAPRLIEHVRRGGFTHVEFLPLMEHPFYGSWGYQVTGYFAATSRYGTPQELMFLIDQLHQAGIGVILDWVPSHFAKDEYALARFDGTALYEHADIRRGLHPDWDSYLFNYGRHEVRSFLLSSADHWCRRYHADALRVDGVASMLYLDYSRQPGEWTPNRLGGREDLDAVHFLQQLNTGLYAEHPGTQVIAEESTAWPGVSKPVELGGLGFGFKWDMGWMHDTLQYLEREPVYRRYHHNELTMRGLYAFSENFVLALSHDEVTHGKRSLASKMPGDPWQQLATLRLLLAYQWSQPGKKLLFMGAELGQWREWDHENELDWGLLAKEDHAGILRLLGDLNACYRDVPAMHDLDCEPGGFSWVDVDDSLTSTLSYLRKGRDGSVVLVACNFTPIPRHGRQFLLPRAGTWTEILNTDSTLYGGSGVGNQGGVVATRIEGRDDGAAIANVTLPPLGCVLLRAE